MRVEPEREGGKMDAMASGWYKPGRERYVANERGEVVPASRLEAPDGVAAAPEVRRGPTVVGDPLPFPMGPTRVFEWLMVDIRVAKAVSPESRLYAICQGLCEGSACGIIEATLVIDLQAMSADDRKFLLDAKNWPQLAR